MKVVDGDSRTNPCPQGDRFPAGVSQTEGSFGVAPDASIPAAPTSTSQALGDLPEYESFSPCEDD